MTNVIEKLAFDDGKILTIGGKQFNGKWIQKVTVAVNNVTLAKDAYITYNLNTYLPNDNYDYEITYMTVANTGSTSGNSVEIQCRAGSTISATPVIRSGYAITRESSTEHYTKTGYIYVKASDRQLTFQNKGNAQTTGFCVYLKGYRRVGLNNMDSDYISNVNIGSTNALIGGNNFDGGWTAISYMITDSVSINAQGYLDFSISNVIPNDSHDYLVLISSWGDSGTASGNSTRMKAINGKYADVSSGTATDFYLFGGITRTASSRSYGGCALVPIRANNRNISINNTGNATASFKGYILGYKKLGLNDDSNNYLEYINMAGETVNFAGNQFDGPWVKKDYTLGTYTSLTYNVDYSIDVSSIIPNDGYNYELLIDGYIWTTTTAGNGAEVYVRGGLTNNAMLARCKARTSSQCDMGSLIVPVSTSRVITIRNSIGSDSGSCNIYLRAYRRIGTNT